MPCYKRIPLPFKRKRFMERENIVDDIVKRADFAYGTVGYKKTRMH